MDKKSTVTVSIIRLIKSTFVWLTILPLAILNGGVREYLLIPYWGEAVAQPISGVLLMGLILMITVFVLPRVVRATSKEYAWIGGLWVVMTVFFEFWLGLTMGHSIDRLLEAYDLRTGNLWGLVVLFLGIAPSLGALLWRGIVRRRRLAYGK